MLKLGIIGCGNAGNQVLAEAFSRYPEMKLIAINSSENDLATLPDAITKIKIGDGNGCGKNRKEAKKSLSDGIMEIVSSDALKKFMFELDLIFVVSSTGGGTGSGVSLVLTKILQKTFPSSYVIPVGILPLLKEGESTQVNTLEYLDELYNKMDKATTFMLYDNDKMKDISSYKMLPTMNGKIVEDFNVLRCYYNMTTKFDSIDEKDALTIIRTPKRLMVASVYDVKEKDLDEMDLEARLVENIKKGPHVEIQEDGIVNRIGTILNVSENVLNTFSVQIPNVLSYVGDPIEEFKHIYVNSDRKLPNNAFLIISGLTTINDRIAKINDRIDEIQEARKKQELDNELDTDIISEINSQRTYVNNENKKSEKLDLGEIFSEFGI